MDLQVAVIVPIDIDDIVKGTLGNDAVLPGQGPDMLHRHIVDDDICGASGNGPRLGEPHANHAGDKSHRAKSEGHFLHLV